ncbi:MAG: deoxyribose-phosphate aldolase [Neisseriaceae bacterium]|nr:deoxyribose-phosphate aldolase [Neisseriaceae bacterium]
MTELSQKVLQSSALSALHFMDLTSLNDTDTPADIQALARAAQTPFGSPAALCVYPAFILTAKQQLAELNLDSVKIATVANFPHGAANVGQAVQQTLSAAALGADEVDLVFPYEALKAGNAAIGLEMVNACRAALEKSVLLKVIIESGELKTPALIQQASEISIEAGADFIKTSTGKVPVNATLAAAEIMLKTIKNSGKPVGFKAAGGVRSAQDAADYLALADAIMGEHWVNASTWRFGASSLLGSLLLTLQQGVLLETKGY